MPKCVVCAIMEANLTLRIVHPKNHANYGFALGKEFSFKCYILILAWFLTLIQNVLSSFDFILGIFNYTMVVCRFQLSSF